MTDAPDTDVTAVAELDIDADALFNTLQDSRRRFVLSCLDTHRNPMALADLADELASWESDMELSEIPAEDVTSVYISLYHVHIPKLADVGLVEYNQERDAVALVAESEALLSTVHLPPVE